MHYTPHVCKAKASAVICCLRWTPYISVYHYLIYQYGVSQKHECACAKISRLSRAWQVFFFFFVENAIHWIILSPLKMSPVKAEHVLNLWWLTLSLADADKKRWGPEPELPGAEARFRKKLSWGMATKVAEVPLRTQMNLVGNGDGTIAKLGEALTAVSINKPLIKKKEAERGGTGAEYQWHPHICMQAQLSRKRVGLTGASPTERRLTHPCLTLPGGERERVHSFCAPNPRAISSSSPLLFSPLLFSPLLSS